MDSGATSSNHSTTDSTLNPGRQASASQIPGKLDQQAHDLTSPSCTILELVLEDKPVAVAVRQLGGSNKSNPSQYHTAGADSARTAGPDTPRDASYVNSKQQGGQTGRAWQTMIYDMEGSVLAAEHEGRLYKGGAMAQHTHTVLTGQSPLVRHLHVVANAAGWVSHVPLFHHALFCLFS